MSDGQGPRLHPVMVRPGPRRTGEVGGMHAVFEWYTNDPSGSA